MSQSPAGVFAASLVALAVLAPCAAAQSAPAPAAPPPPAPAEARGVSIGGDLSAVAGFPDNVAFFNYTDYEHNALRVARLRLAAELRLGGGVSFLAEAQTENGDGVDATAAYVRWRPRRAGALVIQAGRIPPVVGAFDRRAYGRDNPLIGSPLAYQYLASLRPDALPASIDDVIKMRGRGWQSSFPIGSTSLRAGVPLITTRWDTGVEVGWGYNTLEVSTAVTMGSPSVPRVQTTNTGRGVSGRAAVHLPDGVVIGVSAFRGSWIDRMVLDLMPADRRESAQSIVGTDFEWGLGHWLVRGEWLRASYEVPIATAAVPVSHLTSSAAYAEARYRLRPRWSLAFRVDRLGFSKVQGTLNDGLPITWDAPVERTEVAVGFRVRRTVDLRAGWQYDWRDGGKVHEHGYPALQLLVWF